MKRSVLVMAVVAAFFAYAPAVGAVTFDGACEIPGSVTYDKDLKLLPQEVTWKFTSDPAANCTGLVDGQLVVNTPSTVRVKGTGPISCGTVTWTFNAKGVLGFPGLGLSDPDLDATVSLVTPAAQNILLIEGANGGYGTGRGSFLGQNDPVQTLQQCIEEEGVTSLRFIVTMKTAGPMSG